MYLHRYVCMYVSMLKIRYVNYLFVLLSFFVFVVPFCPFLSLSMFVPFCPFLCLSICVPFCPFLSLSRFVPFCPCPVLSFCCPVFSLFVPRLAVRSPYVVDPGDKFSHQQCHCCGYHFETSGSPPPEWCSDCWCPHCSICLEDGEDWPCRSCAGLEVNPYYDPAPAEFKPGSRSVVTLAFVFFLYIILVSYKP